eukprot:scaffold1455_cov87-Cyclotella_meneghiniana.AAC.4
MVQFAIAARALLLASINASEFVVDEQGVYSFTNRHVTFGQELFSKIPDLVSIAKSRILQAVGVSSPPPFCVDAGFDTALDPATVAIMSTHIGMDGVMEGGRT